MQRARVHEVLIRTGLRLVAMIGLWLIVVAFGTASFFAPRGSEVQPTGYDLFGFGCTLAIAAAIAGLVALALAGERRLAGEVLLAVALVLAIGAVSAYISLWAQPLVLRSQMDAWSFLRLREGSKLWAEQLAGFHAPLAAGVGAAVGALAGVLIRLARRRSRLAITLALAILFAFAAGPVQRMLFQIVVLWGGIIHRLIISGSLIDDEISELAAVFGALAGAVIAVLWLRHTYGTRSTRSDVAA
jgi:hypothetical protein